MDYFELNINQRQKDDPLYASMLNRIRIGNQTASDITLLKNKLIPDKLKNKIDNAVDFYMNLIKEKPNTVTLFSRTSDVSEFNCLINLKLCKVELLSK